jgi:hypothetical protein
VSAIVIFGQVGHVDDLRTGSANHVGVSKICSLGQLGHVLVFILVVVAQVSLYPLPKKEPHFFSVSFQ